MTTINALAAEFDMQTYELRAFADDLLDATPFDTDEIPADTEAFIREAIAANPANDD